jgi:hypothetical protein
VVLEPLIGLKLMENRFTLMAYKSQICKDFKELSHKVDHMETQMKTMQTNFLLSFKEQVQSMIDANNKKLQEMWGINSRQPQTKHDNQRPPQAQKDKGLHQDNNGQSFCEGGPSFQEGTNSGDGFQTRSMKFEFLRFDGKDLKTWSCHAWKFFDYYRTPDRQRLSISSLYKEGKGLVWFQELSSSKGLSTWGEFLRLLKIKFGKGISDDMSKKKITNAIKIILAEEEKTK